MLRTLYLFCFLLPTVMVVRAQSPEIDSLKKVTAKLSDLDTNKINNLCDLGRQYWSVGSYEEAVHCGDRALALANKLGYIRGRMTAYNLIAICYMDQAKYPDAISYYLIALKDAEKLKDNKRIAKFYNNIGLVYQAQKTYVKAREYFSKSLALKRQLKEDPKALSSCYTNIGTSFAAEKVYDSALFYHFQALKIDSIGKNVKAIAVAFTNISEVFSNQSKLKECILYNQKSLKLRQQIDDKKGIMLCYYNMGDAYYRLGDNPIALRYVLAGLGMAKDINTPENIADFYGLLADIYNKTKNYEKAYAYRTKYQITHDSIFNIGNSQLMSGSEAKFAVAKKEIELKAKAEAERIKTEAEQRRQRVILFAISAILLLVVGFSFLVYNRYKLISKQKEIIEVQKQEVEHKNAEITQSINYALRIQQAILPLRDEVNQYIPNSFALYKPKDIVSGDFYYFEHVEGISFFAAIDCTGHGVPGAFMSMIGHDALNNIILSQRITSPGKILDALNKEIRSTLKQEEHGNTTRDGMDVALCALIKNEDGTMHCTFAGAMRPLWLIRKNSEMTQIKGDKQPIGGYYNEEDLAFEDKEILMQPGDTFYIFSDGYADQFGGPEGKKLTTSRFKTLLQTNFTKTMEEQKVSLDEAITNWRGQHEQVDDVLVIGVRA